MSGEVVYLDGGSPEAVLDAALRSVRGARDRGSSVAVMALVFDLDSGEFRVHAGRSSVVVACGMLTVAASMMADSMKDV